MVGMAVDRDVVAAVVVSVIVIRGVALVVPVTV